MRANSPLAIVLALLAAVLFTRVMTDAALDGRGDDLVPLVVAGRLVAAGQAAHLYAHDAAEYNRVGDPIFRAQAHESGFPWEPTPFVYPPLVAWLLAPMTSAPFATVARAWMVVSLAAFAVVVWLVLQLYLPHWNEPAPWGVILLAACWFEPLRYGFALGQTTAVIVPLMLGALFCQRRGHAAAAGTLLAIAAFVKLTPILLVLPWLRRGSGRAAAWTAGVVAALSSTSLALAGVPLHAEYLARVRGISRVAVLAYNNVSLLPAVSRFFAPARASLDWRMYAPDAWAAFVTYGVLALSIAGAVLALSRAKRDDDCAASCAEGFALLAVLLLPNIAWTHYYELLLPVVAIVLTTRPAGSRWPIGVAAVAVIVCCRPFLPPQNVPLAGRGAALLAVLPAASLALWVTLASNALASGRRRARP